MSDSYLDRDLPKDYKVFSSAHFKCPPGSHIKEIGKPYCDIDIWASHTFMAVYLSEIYHSGKNCTARERQRALHDACYYYGFVIPIVAKLGRAPIEGSPEAQLQYVDQAEELLLTKLDQLNITPTVNEATWAATVQAFQEFKRQREQRPEEFAAPENMAKP